MFFVRSTKRPTLANAFNSFKEKEFPAGRGKEGTCQAVSLNIPRRSRLVASIFNFGHAASKCSAYFAAASIRCSQLSRTSKRPFDLRAFLSVSMIGSEETSRTPTRSEEHTSELQSRLHL